MDERERINQYIATCPTICQKCRWLDWYYEFGCSQMAYPDAKNKCILYTHQKNFKRFRIWGYDLNYKYWQVKVWLLKLVGKRANIVGSWKQWEVPDEDDGFGMYGDEYGI